jgi:hypothetical protein
MGWRYLVLSLGAITFAMFICRFFFFTLYESPKFLVSKGRQDEAVAAVHGVAYKNKTKTWLTADILNKIGGYPVETKTRPFPPRTLLVDPCQNPLTSKYAHCLRPSDLESRVSLPCSVDDAVVNT